MTCLVDPLIIEINWTPWCRTLGRQNLCLYAFELWPGQKNSNKTWTYLGIGVWVHSDLSLLPSLRDPRALAGKKTRSTSKLLSDEDDRFLIVSKFEHFSRKNVISLFYFIEENSAVTLAYESPDRLQTVPWHAYQATTFLTNSISSLARKSSLNRSRLSKIGKILSWWINGWCWLITFWK